MFQGFQCPRCTSTFIEADQLLSHLSDHERHHDQVRVEDQEPILLSHRCNECAASFDSQEELAFHKITGNHLKNSEEQSSQLVIRDCLEYHPKT